MVIFSGGYKYNFPDGILSLFMSASSLLDKMPRRGCDLASFFFVSKAPTSP